MPAPQQSAMPPTPGAPDNRALPWLLLAVTVALCTVLLPFYGAIMWGGIIALLFIPLHHRLLPLLGQRQNVAASVTLLIVLLMVVLPLVLVGAALVREAALIYQQLQTGELNPAHYFQGVFDALPNWMTAVLDRFGLVSFNTLQRRLTAALTQGTQFIATQTFSVGQNTFEFVAGVFITLYLSFFLIRDGHGLVGAGLVWLPVALYFLMTGALWKCLALVAYGVLVIGLVDNLLRPILIGRDTLLPDYIVLITTLGGMAVFGINGFVLGPVIAAVFIAAWQIQITSPGTPPLPEPR